MRLPLVLRNFYYYFLLSILIGTILSLGLKGYSKKTPNMDSLIAIGSAAAVIYGIFAIYMIEYGLGTNQIELI